MSDGHSASKLLYGVGFAPWQGDLGGQAGGAGMAGHGRGLPPQGTVPRRVRAEEAGVELPLVEGDVTVLADAGADAGVGSGFSLLMDFGRFHDELDDAKRAQEGRAATAAAAPDASLDVRGAELCAKSRPALLAARAELSSSP